MDEVNITYGTEEDFRRAVDRIYENVHWFIAYEDFDVYKRACPHGYRFMVAKNSKGEVVGSSSIALYDDGIAFIDQFFVLPQYRGSGKGRALFEAIFDESLRRKYNIGLHSEVLDDVCKLDAQIWMKPRRDFLTAWIQRKDANFLAVYINEEMMGYGVIRRASCENGYLFGPVYALNDEAFLALFDGLVEHLENDAIIELRSPSLNSDRLHRLLENRATLKDHSKYITQYTKRVPECNYDPVYAITDTTIAV